MSEIGHIHDLPPSRRTGPASTTHKAAEPRAEAGPGEKVDRAEFSDYAQLLGRLAVLPEIRADKVAAVRAQIDAGTYETPDKLEIAVRRALRDLR